MTEQTTFPPVEKSILVPWDRTTAFARFTERIHEWWPLKTHAVDPDRVRSCAIEPREGGRIFEVWDDGTERPWGKVTEWDPPRRLAFTWHPGRSEETRQEVRITFHEEGDGTRLELVHSGWHRLGEKAEETRRQYSPGWDHVLERYAGA